jgi:hypothetical protein
VIFREKRQGQPERLNAGSLHYVVLSVRFVRDRCAPGEHLWQVIAINSFGSLKRRPAAIGNLYANKRENPVEEVLLASGLAPVCLVVNGNSP